MPSRTKALLALPLAAPTGIELSKSSSPANSLSKRRSIRRRNSSPNSTAPKTAVPAYFLLQFWLL